MKYRNCFYGIESRERVEEIIKPYLDKGWHIVGEIKENTSSVICGFTTYSVTLECDYNE